MSSSSLIKYLFWIVRRIKTVLFHKKSLTALHCNLTVHSKVLTRYSSQRFFTTYFFLMFWWNNKIQSSIHFFSHRNQITFFSYIIWIRFSLLLWQRSTLSRAGSAQGSRNAHFIDWRQRETQQNDLIRLLQPHTCLTDITVRLETTHRHHRPHSSHRSHRSHSSHKCHEKRLRFDQKLQSETLRRTATRKHCYIASILHRETRLVTNYNDWMTKIRSMTWKQHLAHVYI